MVISGSAWNLWMGTALKKCKYILLGLFKEKCFKAMCAFSARKDEVKIKTKTISYGHGHPDQNIY